MGVNEHENLSNFTIRHKIRFRNNIFIAVLHFTVTDTIRCSTMPKSYPKMSVKRTLAYSRAVLFTC